MLFILRILALNLKRVYPSSYICNDDISYLGRRTACFSINCLHDRDTREREDKSRIWSGEAIRKRSSAGNLSQDILNVVIRQNYWSAKIRKQKGERPGTTEEQKRQLMRFEVRGKKWPLLTTNTQSLANKRPERTGMFYFYS